VINDKFSGCYPTVPPELKKIEDKHPPVKCFPFLSHHLEDLFLKLPDNDKIDIIGPVITPEEITLDVSVLNEVIGYLVELDVPYSQENIPTNPNFEEKIQFNSLGEQVANILRFSSYQDGALKDYFRLNSSFAKNDLRNTFNQLYNEALIVISDDINKNDLIFFYIVDKAFPSKRKIVQDAIFVLMSYFFSYCDIFEEPIKKDLAIQLPLF
jgi:hypothetical protein